MYIHQLPDWPKFTWDFTTIAPLLSRVRYKQGLLLGRVLDWGFDPRQEASLNMIAKDVITSSQIEGEMLPVDQVKSSIARKLGLSDAGLINVSRDVDGIVEMMLDATQRFTDPVTQERIFAWHGALFPTGRSNLAKISVGKYRFHTDDDPMQVLFGSFGRPKVHFEAPRAGLIAGEMDQLLTYINQNNDEDPILKAAVAHLWFLTIHPFDDGNGRIARALTDLLLCRSDGFKQRFYSMSSAILNARKYYYRTLEQTQKGTLDISQWLIWFLETLKASLDESYQVMEMTFAKARFWQRHISIDLNARQRMILNKLWDGYQGKLTSYRYANITGVSQDTAGRDISDLVAKGILRKGPSGGRSTAYLLVADPGVQENEDQ